MSFGSTNFIFIAYIILVIAPVQIQCTPFYHIYECIDENCQKNAQPTDSVNYLLMRTKNQHTTLASCRLVCGSGAGLWPLPTDTFIISKQYIEINPNFFDLNMHKIPGNLRPLASQMFNNFLHDIESKCVSKKCLESVDSERIVTIHLIIESNSEDLDWATREEYILIVKTEGNNVIVGIEAPTIFGARHGLVTLSQIIAPVKTIEKKWGLVIVDEAFIKDGPIYKHRGLLIDTARNFLPVPDILRTIHGLASVKMNVLHWHATDSQSFPLEIKTVLNMTEFGSYDPHKVYSKEDMQTILSDAKIHGVRVILELDSPSHAGAGWEWGEEAGFGKLAVCVNQDPWRDYCIQPPCGQLNPVNPHTYRILKDIYSNVLEIWNDMGKVLHLGGDEVFINCWNSSSEITSVMAERRMGREYEDFLQLWGEFHREQLNILDGLQRDEQQTIILWSSQLTTPGVVEKYLTMKNFVIQTWVESDSELPNQLLDLGYKLIMSTKNAWYLDHGFWGHTKYHTWQHVYYNRIPRNEQILGGEACMWGEYVNNGNLDSRVWPRTASIAERLWTDPDNITMATRTVESRLQSQIERLLTMDIKSDVIRPEWCTQHEQRCL